MSGTATLMISQPALASRRIWRAVAAASRVSVLVMDCTDTGLPPPTGTLPTWIFFVLLRRGVPIVLFFPVVFHLLLFLTVESDVFRMLPFVFGKAV
jgi:hypothetical protein